MSIGVMYGTTEADLETVARAVGDALGIEPERRDSSYTGDYYSIDAPGMDGRVFFNLEEPDEPEEDDRYRDPGHKECVVLFSVLFDKGYEHLESALGGVAGFSVLERDVFTD